MANLQDGRVDGGSLADLEERPSGQRVLGAHPEQPEQVWCRVRKKSELGGKSKQKMSGKSF